MTSTTLAPNAVVIHTWSDGGCQTNPGPAEAAAVLKTPDGETISTHGYRLPEHATNNVAEHCGLLLALEEAHRAGATHVVAHLDSQVVARQFTGAYSSNGKLAELVDREREVARHFADVQIVEIPRAENKAADAICRAVRAGTFQAGDMPPTRPDQNIQVSFMVTVTMDRSRMNDQLATGKTRQAVIADFAKIVAAKLPLCAQVGDGVVVTRMSK